MVPERDTVMKIILKSDVENLGAAGDVVEVKNGYARNFLIPRGIALEATGRNLKVHEEIVRQTAHKLEKVRNDAEALARRLADTEIVLSARVGEENRIFGTITTQQIAGALSDRGLDVDRRKIHLQEEIRTLGVYTASVKIHADVEGELKVRVVPEAESV